MVSVILTVGSTSPLSIHILRDQYCPSLVICTTSFHHQEDRTMDGEQANRNLQTAVDAMILSLEQNRMRPMQKKTYLAMAACYDSKNSSPQQINACLQNCSQAVQLSQQVIQNEMNQFQNRLQRCAADCDDSIRDKFPDLSDQSKMDKAQGQMNSCLNTCAGEKGLFSTVDIVFSSFSIFILVRKITEQRCCENNLR